MKPTRPNIRMFQQKVLIRELPTPSVQAGKLVVPDTVAKNLGRGKIVAVDEGKLRVGDTILYDNRQAMPCNLEGEEFFILAETSILAVLGKPKTRKLFSGTIPT